jgi:phytoene/squalene synthetase
MGRLYQGILSKIERGGFNVWAGRVRLSAWDKLRAVLFG